MKLLHVPGSLALIALLALSTACNSAKFTGKSGLNEDETAAPTETTPEVPGTENPGTTPGTDNPGTTPGTENPGTTPGNPNPGTPGTEDPDVTNPGTPGTPGTPGNPGTPGTPGTGTPNPDPDCAAKGTCEVPCDPMQGNCPTIPDECTIYGINCPGQGPDDPTQSDDPRQNG